MDFRPKGVLSVCKENCDLHPHREQESKSRVCSTFSFLSTFLCLFLPSRTSGTLPPVILTVFTYLQNPVVYTWHWQRATVIKIYNEAYYELVIPSPRRQSNNKDKVLRKRERKFYCSVSKGETLGTAVPEAVILTLSGNSEVLRGTQRLHSSGSLSRVIIHL